MGEDEADAHSHLPSKVPFLMAALASFQAGNCLMVFHFEPARSMRMTPVACGALAKTQACSFVRLVNSNVAE